MYACKHIEMLLSSTMIMLCYIVQYSFVV